MTHIYSATRYDTPAIAALREEINSDGQALDALLREHRHQERELCDEYARLLRAQRPRYPARRHVRGLEQIAALVHEGRAYGDHLGHATRGDLDAGRALPRSVLFSAHASRLNVYADAPYAPGSGARLWEFTVEEIEDFRSRLRDLSLAVIDEWVHEDGVGFIVRSKRV
jgi:hypothetical protein